jgi:hypothetical protein
VTDPTRRDALFVIARWRADDRNRARITDGDRAQAQDLLRRFKADGLVVVQLPEQSALGPGTPSVLPAAENVTVLRGRDDGAAVWQALHDVPDGEDL